MCDTLIAAPEVTKNKTTIFAKNSDRPPNEAQHLAWFPAQTHSPGMKVRLLDHIQQLVEMCLHLEIQLIRRLFSEKSGS